MPKLTDGSIFESLIKLSVPIVIANMMQTAYQLIDTFWVGRLGAEAVAAVSISFPVVFLMISLGGGLFIAGTIYVSQYKGKEDTEQINHIIGQTYFVMIIASILLSIIGYFATEPLVSLMGATSTVARMAVSYIQILFIGLIFLFGYFVYESLMRGLGDVKTPLIIVTFTVILNFFFDPLFIFGWGPIPPLGVAGVAWATVATQSIATLIGLALLLRGKEGIRLSWSLPESDTIKKLFRLGLPSSFEQTSIALGLIAMTFIATRFTTDVLAAYGLGVRFFSFIVIPAIGISIATSTLVGQSMGAGKIKRAEEVSRISAGLGFLVLTLIGILFFVFAEPMAAAFIADETVIALTAEFVRTMALTFGFFGVYQTLVGTFRGSGNTVTAMIFAILSLWVFRIPVAYVLGEYTSLAEHGLWWSFTIANVLSGIVTLGWFLKGSWKEKRLTEDETMGSRITEQLIVDEGLD